MSRGTIGKIEAGVRALRWSEALALAAALGTDPAYLGLVVPLSSRTSR